MSLNNKRQKMSAPLLWRKKKTEKIMEARAKQRRKHPISCCDHVNKIMFQLFQKLTWIKLRIKSDLHTNRQRDLDLLS